MRSRPTDRLTTTQARSSYKTLDVERECFTCADGLAAVWELIRRVSRGAVPYPRGWQT
jgi:hypothetical protein